MPTQCYNSPSRKVRKRFSTTLLVELNGVRAQKWNYERAIIFQSVILQRAQAVNNAKHIRLCIQFIIYWWNCGEFEKLLKETFNAATWFLGKSCGIQSYEKFHRTFSNLALKGRLCEAVRFVCARETGEFFNQTNWQRIKRALLKKPPHWS